MTYKIEITAKAEKERLKLPKRIRGRIDDAIDQLADNPRPPGSIKLAGEQNFYRNRVGDYRVIYSVFEDVVTVLIVRVRHRKDAYRNG